MTGPRSMPARLWRAYTRSTSAAICSTLVSAVLAWAAVEAVIDQRDAWWIGSLIAAAIVCLIMPMLPEDEADPATMDEIRF